MRHAQYAYKVCASVLAALMVVPSAGCAQHSAQEPSSSTVTVDSETVHEEALWDAVRTEFTPEALRAYVEYMQGDKVGKFLGSSLVEGRKTFPIAKADGTADSMYAITYYCDSKHDAPFSIGMQKGEQYHQMMYVEGCPATGDTGTVAGPEKQFPDATGVTVDAGGGRVIAAAYEVKED